ncbi:MAG: FtsW/RodA/SpoVE family cell cycle protein, partial [Abditibacteriaceae bacterium]
MAVITSPINVGSGTTRFSWRHFDWFLLALVVILSVWGCATVASAILPHNSGINGSWWQMMQSEGIFSDVFKQGLWIVVGLLALFALARTNYQWLMHLQFWIYAGNLALLLFVLIAPHSLAPTINGAKSWLRFGPLALQPGEFCKFAVLISMAAFLARRQDHIQQFRVIALSLLYLIPPLIFILKQPDLGTVLAVMSIWFGMLFFGGAKLTHLGGIVLVGLLLFGAAWKFDILKQHQRERLAVFLDQNPSPEAMQAGGYQIKQSQIAIGAGGITGQGWGRGMQNRSGYVPENTTDFIFTVTAEEDGFV